MLHDARQPLADRRTMDLVRLKLGRPEPWHLSGNGHSAQPIRSASPSRNRCSARCGGPTRPKATTGNLTARLSAAHSRSKSARATAAGGIFEWKGYRRGGQLKTMVLNADEFIRRFPSTDAAEASIQSIRAGARI
jgi:hypothetical protein